MSHHPDPMSHSSLECVLRINGIHSDRVRALYRGQFIACLLSLPHNTRRNYTKLDNWGSQCRVVRVLRQLVLIKPQKVLYDPSRECWFPSVSISIPVSGFGCKCNKILPIKSECPVDFSLSVVVMYSWL